MTSGDVAKRFLVSNHTVARWAREGLLPAMRTPGGQLRFRRTDVESFLETREPEAVA
ncbi:MAG: helix-turn-helix domain-containing protein [Chloroflexi bacterium]|nr:helix-turn-helix domain-containing protein [Chloroflexota bacterium]